MSETITIRTERVDDIPLLVAQLTRMGVPVLLDQHFPSHGNRQGLSLGWTATVWLSHILSQADHRLNHVQAWAETHLVTLTSATQQPLRPLDVSDDRLADVLRALADDQHWQAYESAQNGHLLRVYDLHPRRVRLDSTTASGYWEVTEDGLFQFGHSKDHRPDLPQVKVMLAVLDPLGLPVATDVLSGERADDPLYQPAIERVRASLGQVGLLYVGDSKLGALGTRAAVATAGDFYLCPLSAVQLSAEELAQALLNARATREPPVAVERVALDGTPTRIAEGYEWTEKLSTTLDGQTVSWTERRLLVRSLAAAEAAETALRARLAQAQAELTDLTVRRRGKARWTDPSSLQTAVDAILQRQRVVGLLTVAITQHTTQRAVRAYRDRPARQEVDTDVRLSVAVDAAAVESAVADLGWRVYATNQPVDQLPLAQAVLAYRDEYLVEHGLGRLKGQPLSLTPMYLERDDHATGLIRLLSIALRVLCLLEFVVRRRLAQENATLVGLYAGQPKRATARPTAERLLEAFKNITLTRIDLPDRHLSHMTPLSPLQQRILALLDFSSDIYARLAHDSREPPQL